MWKVARVAFTFCLASCIASNTPATLIGDTVGAQFWSGSGLNSSASGVVAEGTGDVLTLYADYVPPHIAVGWWIDIEASQIRITGFFFSEGAVEDRSPFGLGGYGVIRLVDLDWPERPGCIRLVNLGVTADHGNTTPFLVPAPYDELAIDISDTIWHHGDTLIVYFSDECPVVPEPSTVCLLGVGLGLLSFLHPRRKTRRARGGP